MAPHNTPQESQVTIKLLSILPLNHQPESEFYTEGAHLITIHDGLAFEKVLLTGHVDGLTE